MACKFWTTSLKLSGMRRSRCCAVLLIVLFALAVVPGIVEAAENAYHLVLHGDLAHSSLPGHSPFNQQEHGCGAGCHLCSCCHSPLFEYSAVGVLAAPLTDAGVPPAVGPTSIDSGFLTAPEDPPRV